MKKTDCFKKGTAFFILICFAATLQGPGSYASETRPGSSGKTEESFQGNSGKKIFYIQDAHDSLEAQESIARIIRHLVEREGIQTVFEEGYEGAVPSDEWFGSISDPAIKERTAYYLMDQLRLGGAEYAHINRKGDFKLIGADNIRLHLANIRAYQKQAELRNQAAKDLEHFEREFQKLGQKKFPPALKEWLKLKERFEANQIPLLDYLKRTMSLRRDDEHVIPAKAGIHFSVPNIEILLAAENSHDPALLEKARMIQAKTLFEEINRFENDFAKTMLKDEKARQVFKYLQGIHLLERLNRLEVNPQEFEALRPLLNEFKTRDLALWLAKESKKTVLFSSKWEEAVARAVKFYEIAQQRDEAVEKTLESWLYSGATLSFPRKRESILDYPSPGRGQGKGEKMAILVFGGFHKDRILEILRKHGISYEVITPEMTGVDKKHQDYYKFLMSKGPEAVSLASNLPKATRFMNFYEGIPPNPGFARAELRSIEQTVEKAPGLEYPLLGPQISRDLKTFYRDAASKRSEARSTMDGKLGREYVLDAYITRQNVLRTYSKKERKKLKEKVFANVQTQRLDSLIERQAESDAQALVEWISNALDAARRKKRPIGRFGMGFFQSLQFLSGDDNLPFENSNQILINTQTPKGQAHRVSLYHGDQGKWDVRFKVDGAEPGPVSGTEMKLLWKKPLSAETLQRYLDFLAERLHLQRALPIYLNGQILNPLKDYLYVNGGQVHYDAPDQRVEITLDENGFTVRDPGQGMSRETIFNKLLIPREGMKTAELTAVETPEEIEQEIALFYKAPSSVEQGMQKMRGRLQVSGVMIQPFELEGLNLPAEIVLDLPSTTRISGTSRNVVEIDAVIHAAVEAFAKKLTRPNLTDQDALINGFMRIVQWMDEKNKRVDVYRPLADTARELFLPWLKEQGGQILPNDEAFHELASEDGTRFLEASLLYSLHPSQIPGAKEVLAFRPGTAKHAYTVPFKKDSEKSFIQWGDALLINEDYYNLHREFPVQLNLAFNFYVGYGPRPPFKGELIPVSQYEAEEKARKEAEEQRLLKEEEKVRVRKDAEAFIRQSKMLRYLSLEVQRGIAAEMEDYESRGLSLLKQLDEFLTRLENPVFIGPLNDENQISSMVTVLYQKKNSAEIFFPDAGYVRENAAFFLHPGKEEYLQNYLTNLLNVEKGEMGGMKQKSAHQLLSVMDSAQYSWGPQYGWISQETLDALGKELEKENLETWVEYYKTVFNASYPVKDPELFDRIHRRWLRIFKNDRKAAKHFHDLLGQDYERKKPQPLPPPAAEEIPSRLPQFEAARILGAGSPHSRQPYESLKEPGVFTVGRNGLIYVFDKAEEAILIYDKNGDYKSRIKMALLNSVNQMVVDSQGFVYVLTHSFAQREANVSAILAFKPNGASLPQSILLGQVFPDLSRLDIQIDPQDRLVVLDRSQNSLFGFERHISDWPLDAPEQPKLIEDDLVPGGNIREFRINSQGHVYVQWRSDVSGETAINHYNRDMTLVNIITSDLLEITASFAVDSEGKIYLRRHSAGGSEEEGEKIKKIWDKDLTKHVAVLDPNGKVLLGIMPSPPYNVDYQLAFDAEGNMYRMSSTGILFLKRRKTGITTPPVAEMEYRVERSLIWNEDENDQDIGLLFRDTERNIYMVREEGVWRWDPAGKTRAELYAEFEGSRPDDSQNIFVDKHARIFGLLNGELVLFSKNIPGPNHPHQIERQWALDGEDWEHIIYDPVHDRFLVWNSTSMRLYAMTKQGPVRIKDEILTAPPFPEKIKRLMRFGPDGRIYVIMPGGKEIITWRPDGSKEIQIVNLQTADPISDPVDLKFDAQGNFYLAEANRLRLFSPEGKLLHTLIDRSSVKEGRRSKGSILSILPGDNGEVIVSDGELKKTYVMKPFPKSGQEAKPFEYELEKEIPIHVDNPRAIVAGRNGEIYFTHSEEDNVIYRIDAQGKPKVLAKIDLFTSVDKLFFNPHENALYATGELHPQVAEGNEHRHPLMKIITEGEQAGLFATIPAKTVTKDLIFDAEGRTYRIFARGNTGFVAVSQKNVPKVEIPLDFPNLRSIALDEARGLLYVLFEKEPFIQAIDIAKKEKVSEIFLSDKVGINFAEKLKVDKDGNLLVTARGPVNGYRVHQFDSAGIYKGSVPLNESEKISLLSAAHDIDDQGRVLIANGQKISIWKRKEAASPVSAVAPSLPHIRRGFDAVNPADDLDGIPPLVRNIIRFLREEKMAYVEEKEPPRRGKNWEKIEEFKNISLGKMNLLFQQNARVLKAMEKEGLSPEKLKEMLAALRSRKTAHLEAQIQSGIAAQPKTERVWIREAGIQNPITAIAREREAGRLAMNEGEITHKNFLYRGKWIYLMKDPAGISTWKAVRYYFPLDESDARPDDLGFFGQGNYTLYGDSDGVFLRTSPSDPQDPGYGLVNEFQIASHTKRGPVIKRWSIYRQPIDPQTGKVEFTGTETWLERDQTKSDPQLETLFIQDALARNGGLIRSPELRQKAGEPPNIRDVKITMDGEPIHEKIEPVAHLKVAGLGEFALERSPAGVQERVAKDNIFVKLPDNKELELVLKKMWDRLSARGPLQLKMPHETPLNIPRNSYAQNQKFLSEHKMAWLLLMMKANLKEYMATGVELPGFPQVFYGSSQPVDPAAFELAREFNQAEKKGLGTVSLENLKPYLDDERKFFELLSHIEFQNPKGETLTLQKIRETVRQEMMDEKDWERLLGADASSLFETHLRGSRHEAERQRDRHFAKSYDTEEFKKQIPEAGIKAFEEIFHVILSIMHVKDTEISYYAAEDKIPASVRDGNHIFLNLFYTKPWMETLARLREQDGKYEEWKKVLYEMWQKVFAHEVNHLRAFEKPGTHTHHSDQTVDLGFGDRMRKTIDRIAKYYSSTLQPDGKLQMHINPDYEKSPIAWDLRGKETGRSEVRQNVAVRSRNASMSSPNVFIGDPFSLKTKMDSRFRGNDTIQTFFENMRKHFTVFMDLKNAAALTPQQFEEDFEKPLQLSKNIHFVFYGDETKIPQSFRDQLEKLQSQFGADRLSVESRDISSLLGSKSWRGELIHIGKGEEAGPPLIGKPLYRFRYLADEIHLVPVALLFADQGIRDPKDRPIDLSMVSEALQSQVRQYFASLIIAHSA